MQPGEKKNRMIFEDRIKDAYGMPQPTFEYLPSEKAARKANDMMGEYVTPSDTNTSPEFLILETVWPMFQLSLVVIFQVCTAFDLISIFLNLYGYLLFNRLESTIHDVSQW